MLFPDQLGRSKDFNRSTNVETPSLGPALGATIVTPDLDASLEAWTAHLHHRVHERGRIEAEQARRWGRGALAGRLELAAGTWRKALMPST